VGPAASGPCTLIYGAGNSLMTRGVLAHGFDPCANESGGEDDLLFAAARREGARFAWAADAVVREHVPQQRLSARYALRRAFAYGQGPCETAFATRNMAVLARHVVVGAAQLAAFAPLALALWLIKTNWRMAAADIAARGAGKVFWFATQKF